MTAPGWGSWDFEPIVVVVLALASVLYARAYSRASRSAPKPPGAGHWAFFYSGIAVIVIALLSPIDAIGDSYLLSAHMLQHVLLADIAPALIVLGLRAPVLPLGLSKPALRAVAPGSPTGRWLARLTSPWVAVPVWVTVTWVWAIPSVFDFATQHQLLHDFEHLTLFYAGLALWWLIIDPLPRQRLRSNGSRLALLGITRWRAPSCAYPSPGSPAPSTRSTRPRRAPTASRPSTTSTSRGQRCASSRCSCSGSPSWWSS